MWILVFRWFFINMKFIWLILVFVYFYYLVGSGKNWVNLIENIEIYFGILVLMWVLELLNFDFGLFIWNGILNWDGVIKWDGMGFGRDKFSVGKNIKWDLNWVIIDMGSCIFGLKIVIINVNVDGNVGFGLVSKIVVKEIMYFNKFDINLWWMDILLGNRMCFNGGSIDIDNFLIFMKRIINIVVVGLFGIGGVGGLKMMVMKIIIIVNKNVGNIGNLNGGYFDFLNIINNIKDKMYVEKIIERWVNEVVNKDILLFIMIGGWNMMMIVDIFDSIIMDLFVMEGGVSIIVIERFFNGVSKVIKIYRNLNGNIIKIIIIIIIINEIKIILFDEFGGGLFFIF